MHKPRFCRAEATFLVEPAKVRLEVYVYPLDPAFFSYPYGHAYQTTTDAASTKAREHGEVQLTKAKFLAGATVPNGQIYVMVLSDVIDAGRADEVSKAGAGAVLDKAQSPSTITREVRRAGGDG